jgi:hypothetical protein
MPEMNIEFDAALMNMPQVLAGGGYSGLKKALADGKISLPAIGAFGLTPLIVDRDSSQPGAY